MSLRDDELAAIVKASGLRAPTDLTDEELSQELYNCAAFLTSACDPEEAEDGEVSLELISLLLLRATDIVHELAGESMVDVARKCIAEDKKILGGTDSRIETPAEEEPA